MDDLRCFIRGLLLIVLSPAWIPGIVLLHIVIAAVEMCWLLGSGERSDPSRYRR